MNILVVEDEIPKRESISETISKFNNAIVLDFAMSVRSAINFISLTYYDFIVLDMSLPTFDVSQDEFGGRPQDFGGVEIIRYLERLGCQSSIAIVTAYETFQSEDKNEEEDDDDEFGEKEITLHELQEKLTTEFPDLEITIIKYDTLMDDWKQLLIESIENKMDLKD